MVPICPDKFILTSFPPLAQAVMLISVEAEAIPAEVTYPFTVPPAMFSEVIVII